MENLERIFNKEKVRVAMAYSLEKKSVFAMYKNNPPAKEVTLQGFEVQRYGHKETESGLRDRDLLFTEPFLSGSQVMGDEQEYMRILTYLYASKADEQALKFLHGRSLTLLEKSKRDLSHARYQNVALLEKSGLPLERAVFGLEEPEAVYIPTDCIGPMKYSLLYMAAKERYAKGSGPVSIKEMLDSPKGDFETVAALFHSVLMQEGARLTLSDAQMFFLDTSRLLRAKLGI